MGWAIYYEIKHGEASILRCVGDGGPLTIPSTIQGWPVTALGSDCFGSGCAETADRLLNAEDHPLPPFSRESSNLCRITLPDTVAVLGDRALARCSQLRRLTLPSGLTALGQRVFEFCDGLEHISLPDGVAALPDYAFSQCRKLERVELPSSLTSLGHHAFYNCVSLSSLVLPDSVSFVGEGLFMNCRALSRLSVPLGVNLSVLLSDLSNALDLTVRFPDGIARFFLPGFSYEYEDINAPRMWRTITYGSGQLYRECFSSRDIDFDLYEDYFDLALKQDEVKDTVQIAFYRLRWPYGLTMGRELYLNHIKSNCPVLLEQLMEQDDLEGLEVLLGLAEWSTEELDTLTAAARKKEKLRFVSRLMDARMGMGGGADKEFDL